MSSKSSYRDRFYFGVDKISFIPNIFTSRALSTYCVKINGWIIKETFGGGTDLAAALLLFFPALPAELSEPDDESESELEPEPDESDDEPDDPESSLSLLELDESESESLLDPELKSKGYHVQTDF